jgi:hypothetical protein
MKEIHVISLGAGVQSSTIALMAAHGEITPMPVAAIFADTQDEPKSVYDWLGWLETQLPYPVIRVSRGRLSEDKRTLVPAFTATGLMARQCTTIYKVQPIQKAINALLRQHQAELGYQWIGISLDELYRMKPNPTKKIINRWPLIEREIKRYQCLRWMRLHGYPTPPRSACVFCPYHSNAEWKLLKAESPKDFAKAVAFERNYGAYLHRSLGALDQVDFSTDFDRGQLSLFGNECEGLCGV